MKKKYSVAIYPSQDVIDSVKTMKGYLKHKIGWYNSCNSVAHITICEFTFEEDEAEKLKHRLLRICDSFNPAQIYLDHFGSFDTAGTFFIAPDQDSKIYLEPMMKKIQDSLHHLKIKKSTTPHLSIGRKLTPDNIKIASQLFTTIAIDFLCDAIVLRELDPIEKQYFVIATFPFGSNPQPEIVQGSLFE